MGIEEGLSEDASHMARNKLCTEPWVLPPADLCVAAAAVGDLDHRYVSKVPVAYTRGAQYPGRPLELPLVVTGARTPGGHQQHGAIAASSGPPIGSDNDTEGASSLEQTQEQRQQIFFDRVARVAAAVATAPEWVRLLQQRMHRHASPRARSPVLELLMRVIRTAGRWRRGACNAWCRLLLGREGAGRRRARSAKAQSRTSAAHSVYRAGPTGSGRAVEADWRAT